MGWMSSVARRKTNRSSRRSTASSRRVLSHVGTGKPVDVPIRDRSICLGVPKSQLIERRSDCRPTPRTSIRTFLTTMFLHGGWMHLLIEHVDAVDLRQQHRGSPRPLHVRRVLPARRRRGHALPFRASIPSSDMPVIGASGAVAAVLGGYAVTYPSAKVRTLIFFHFICDRRYAGAGAAGNLVRAANVIPGMLGAVGRCRRSRSPFGPTSAASWPA